MEKRGNSPLFSFESRVMVCHAKRKWSAARWGGVGEGRRTPCVFIHVSVLYCPFWRTHSVLFLHDYVYTSQKMTSVDVKCLALYLKRTLRQAADSAFGLVKGETDTMNRRRRADDGDKDAFAAHSMPVLLTFMRDYSVRSSSFIPTTLFHFSFIVLCSSSVSLSLCCLPLSPLSRSVYVTRLLRSLSLLAHSTVFPTHLFPCLSFRTYSWV